MRWVEEIMGRDFPEDVPKTGFFSEKIEEIQIQSRFCTQNSSVFFAELAKLLSKPPATH